MKIICQFCVAYFLLQYGLAILTGDPALKKKNCLSQSVRLYYCSGAILFIFSLKYYN